MGRMDIGRWPAMVQCAARVWAVYGYAGAINDRPVPKGGAKETPLRKWCRNTGWHGIADCYEAENGKVRAFWLITVGLSSLLGANQIFSMLHDYWSEEQWVTSMRYYDAGGHGLPMPNLTLCSFNPFNRTYLDQLGVPPSTLMLSRSQNTYAFYQQYLNVDEIRPNTSQYNEAVQDDLARLRALLAKVNGGEEEGAQEILRNASHSCKASVLACGPTEQWLTEEDASCCDKYSYQGPDHCIRLSFADNNGEPLSIRTEGGGVYMLLHPRLHDYSPLFTPGNMPAAGFTVSVSLHNDASSIALALSPGTHNTLWMTLEHRRTLSRRLLNAVQHLHQLTPPCTRGIPYKVMDQDHYNPESCRADCALWLSLTTCGCVLSTGDPIRKIFNVCSAEQSVACGIQQWNDSMSDELLRQCQSTCIEPCSYGLIRLTHNAVAYPAPKMAASLQRFVSRALQHNFSLDDVEQFISVRVVYESMYTRTVEKFNRVSLDELISNIGGTLGVWTGISLISVIQIFAYMGYCLCAKWRARSHRSVVQKAYNRRWLE